jgi:D-alanine-D-alanine ligase
MSNCGRVIVLHGATLERPDEADTIAQAEQVAEALGRLGWDAGIAAVGLDLGALAAVLTPRPAFVFNLVEALDGDGSLIHLVPGVLEHLRVSYTGASPAAHFLTTHKPVAKRLMRAAGLPTPDWLDPGSAPDALAGYSRAIVKPAAEDASWGIEAGSVVPAADAPAALAARAKRFGGAWFAEAFVDGREFNVGLIEVRDRLEVLPIAEILFIDYPADRPRIVDYEAKWQGGSFGFDHTPRSFHHAMYDAPLLERIEGLAEAAFRCFGLRGYGRVDLRVDAAGQPWILEVNANPCLAADAGFMASAARAGLSIDDVVARIVEASGIAMETAPA